MSEPNAEVDLGLDPAAWPPKPLVTERLVLTERRPADREDLVELRCSEPAFRYLGGPSTREDAEREADRPGRPGVFAIRRPASGGAPDADTDPASLAFVGFVGFDRRSPELPGHLDGAGAEHGGEAGAELEFSYVLHPDGWGRGFGYEAARAALGWAASVLPDERVIAVTQSANEPSIRLLRRLGFTEVERFHQFGAEQSLNVADLDAYR